MKHLKLSAYFLFALTTSITASTHQLIPFDQEAQLTAEEAELAAKLHELQQQRAALLEKQSNQQALQLAQQLTLKTLKKAKTDKEKHIRDQVLQQKLFTTMAITTGADIKERRSSLAKLEREIERFTNNLAHNLPSSPTAIPLPTLTPATDHELTESILERLRSSGYGEPTIFEYVGVSAASLKQAARILKPVPPQCQQHPITTRHYNLNYCDQCFAAHEHEISKKIYDCAKYAYERQFNNILYCQCTFCTSHRECQKRLGTQIYTQKKM